MEVTRIFDLLERYSKLFPKTDALAAKQGGKWKTYSTDEYKQLVNWVSCGMLASGIKPGDKVATSTNNRPEWNFIDMGLAQIGAVHVPIYTTISNEDFAYILDHSDARMLFVGDKLMYNKLKPFVSEIKGIEKFYCFNEVENVPFWYEIVEAGKKSEAYYKDELEKLKKSVKPSDLATIIYTSGTTGLSKGVMLSHSNLLSNAIASAARQHMNSGNRALSFLPLSHVFERMVNYKYQYLGISIYYAESVATVGANINELKVDGFIAVPRLLEAVFDKIMDKGQKLTGIKRKIFMWAVKIGFKFEPGVKKSFIYQIQHKIADKLVFTKWREALSPNITFIGCGGAALQPRLARIFWAAGLPVYEGYGLSETSPVIAVNYSKPGKVRVGTVGTILEGMSVKIADDGEILCRGEGVMMGYYKDLEKTAEVIDADGWFHTGDIGNLDKENFLKITDRKKEIFKMSSGKYIAPQMIENIFKESKVISQVMVVGENMKFASAIISPNFDALIDWCKSRKIHFDDPKELINMPKVVEYFQDEIKLLNKRLGEFEQIKKFKLVAEEWSTLSGELSPTLKLKRKVLAQKYQDLINQIYAGTMSFS